MDIDLNEDHYDYESLLRLFSLSPGFNESDLKQAKRKVLKLHPDKCQLPVEYFLFFQKMYLKVEEIFHFSSHAHSEAELEKQIDIETHFKTYLERNNINPKTNFKEFSREFNKMFEQVYVKQEDGHGDWLKSNQNMYHKDDLEKTRKETMTTTIVARDDIEEMGDFGKKTLYEYDVKESLGNPVIALDVQDVYDKKPKFNTVQEFQMYIENEDNSPLNTSQSEEYLKQKEDLLHNQSKELAYKHMQAKQAMDDKYKDYIANYLSITN